MSLPREGSGDRESFIESQYSAQEEMREYDNQRIIPNSLHQESPEQKIEDKQHFDYQNQQNNDDAYAMLRESQNLIKRFNCKFYSLTI